MGGVPPVTHTCFVDESGDEGINRGSRYFIVGAVVAAKVDVAAIEGDFANLRTEMRMQPKDPVHFRNLSHPNRKHASARIGAQPRIAVAAVISDTQNIPDPTWGPTLTRPKNWLYHYMTRYLVERVGRIVIGTGGTGVDVMFSNRSSLSYSDLEGYIKKLAADPVAGAEVSVVQKVQAIQHDQSSGLQIADVAISGIYQAFEPDSHGRCERSYVEALAPRLYRPGGIVLGNGLKLMGKKAIVDGLVAGDLAWIKKL